MIDAAGTHRRKPQTQHHRTVDEEGMGKLPDKVALITWSGHEEQARAGAADDDCSKGALRDRARTPVPADSEMGMTVNDIASGMVLTPFNQQAIDDPEFRQELVRSVPLERSAQPEEIGRLVRARTIHCTVLPASQQSGGGSRR